MLVDSFSGEPDTPSMKRHAFAIIAGLFSLCGTVSAEPPFSGTIFIDPDIITSADPTTYVKVIYRGKAVRSVFDRRMDQFSKVKVHIFTARYSDSHDIEVQVNPEFGGRIKAKAPAVKFAKVLGRLPKVLRDGIDSLTIHDGLELFGGGSHNVLVHTLQSKEYERDGILEETLVHEASHAALDDKHASSAGWLKAQKADPEFISTYARDNPDREDIAETFLTYLAVRYRRDRISDELANQITTAIPARIKYFDRQKFAVSPVD